mmetsp:Transcript_35478/g.36865  ORF Transcript_35478/g.36865 Transcript_35478/m.36865 type:complete len:409 (+) Transcript_35478:21-1247(+)
MDNINLDKLVKAEDADHNMILNVPEEVGLKIQEVIENEQAKGGPVNIEVLQSYNDKLSLEESRKLIFKINNTLLPATIMDYPCIIEAQKTMDYKTFYKSGDISQMLYVHEQPISNTDDIQSFEPFRCNDKIFNSLIWNKDPDHLYKAKHGMTLPTKNIRSRRFKVKKRHNKEEVMNVCKKIKHIIDNGAANFEKSINANGEIVALNADSKDNKSITNHSNKNLLSLVNTEAVDERDESESALTGPASEAKAKTKAYKIIIPNMVEPSEASINNSNSNIINLGSADKKEKAKQTRKNSSSVNHRKVVSGIDSSNNLALREEQVHQPTQNNNIVITNTNTEEEDEKKKEYLANEFNRLKTDYSNIKKVLEVDPSNIEKLKMKKYLKKKLKIIKAEYNALFQGEAMEEDSN